MSPMSPWAYEPLARGTQVGLKAQMEALQRLREDEETMSLQLDFEQLKEQPPLAAQSSRQRRYTIIYYNIIGYD